MFSSTRHLEETNIRESIRPSLVSDKSGNMMRRAHEGNKNKKQKGFVAYYLPPDTHSSSQLKHLTTITKVEVSK